MFELQMEDCLIRGDSSGLVSLLQGLSSSTLTMLHHLVTKELCSCGFSRVLLVMKSLTVLSENREDLQMLLRLQLTAKVTLWFEAVRDLLTSDLQRDSTPLFTLTEKFFDYFLLLGQSSLPVCQLSVVLLQLARFSLETEIHFPLRLEAIRTFNSILESLSRDQRRLIQNDQNQTQILPQVAAAVLTVGDYELQVSLSEALCRLTPRRDREQEANQWFSSRDISSAFCSIRDADFEVDCRRFLNFVNSYHGDQRRVYTFPCQRAFLGSTQLFRPKDDKLDEFWIDFNVGSGCVSFFIDDPQGFLWDSIHLLREEVDSYSLQVSHGETVLSVHVTDTLQHRVRGQTVELSFSCQHHQELEEASRRVFNTGPSSPRKAGSCGTIQISSADRHTERSYSRKKPPNKSQLKVLPLSSPSSEEDSSTVKPTATNRAEVLFDQIKHSTPKFNYVFQLPFDSTSDVSVSETHLSDLKQPASGVQDEMKPEKSQDQELEQKNSCLSKKEVQKKREAADSGYLSDQTEGVSARKKKAGPQEEEDSVLTGAEPTAEDGIFKEGLGTMVPEVEPMPEQGAEPESHLTSDITSAFKSFKAQLEQHFTDYWQKIEAEVLLSVKQCQQHVSSLLTAVHQHRLMLLQSFEKGVTDQLQQLEENSTNLSSINTQILRFFQSEMQQLSLFCEEHLQKLETLERGPPS